MGTVWQVVFPMAVTPSEIFALALERHRQPWNWTLHFAALVGFLLTLVLHSYLMFAATVIVFGAGFFDLHMPLMQEGRWQRFMHDGVEWEKNWIAAPWNWRKTWRLLVVLGMIYTTIWAFWTREPVAISLIIAFIYLAKVVRENIEGGIDP